MVIIIILSCAVAHELEQLFIKQSALEVYFEWLDSIIEKRISEVRKGGRGRGRGRVREKERERERDREGGREGGRERDREGGRIGPLYFSTTRNIFLMGSVKLC